MPVCIAGMHRSGTSMVTNMLHEAGLYLGPMSDLIPPDPPRDEEHWENKRFVRINRAILGQLGGAWDSPPPGPVDWTSSHLDPYREEAEALLVDFKDREPWGWKDPRSCLTLPFWQAILGQTPVVMIIRNPLEVARSLRRRNGYSLPLGLALWQAYNQRLCDAVAKSDRIVTHYDMYFEDPAGELRRVLAFLGLATDEKTIAKATAAQLPERRHHRMTVQDLRNANVSSAIVDLYRHLSEEANWLPAGGDDSDQALSATFHEEDLEPSPGRSASADPTARADRRSERRASEGRLRQQLDEALARIAELEQMVEGQRLEVPREGGSGQP